MKFLSNNKFVHFLLEKHYIDHLPFISVGIISGVVCCFYAKFFSYVEELNVKLMHSDSNLFFLLSPILLSLSFLIVTKFAQGAAGSGIPQVMACIEKDHKHLSSIFLTFKVIVIKIVSSLLAVFSGAAIGREGPSLQISAGIAHNIGRLSKKLGIHVKSEQLLIAGAASGLAAAFNTPIGGVVYAVEELSHEHVRSFKDTLLMSVVISGFTAQLILGNYLYLGYPKLTPSLGLKSILIVSVVALICGMLGSLFSMLLTRLIKWRSSKSFRFQIVTVISVALLLVFFFVFFGERTVLSGKESINFVLFTTGEMPLSEVVLRFVSPLLSSLTGIAGGIFAPSLSAGAVLGGFAAEFLDPTLRNTLGLSGMIGFLTGVTRTPITSFVLVLEMTDRHSAVLPMMFAAVFSNLGAHVFGHKSFYENSLDTIKETYPVQK
jgi:H+/Cl- antiporter ClcA